MSEIDINRVENSNINENYNGEKESLINELKKATFFVDYFKRKGGEKATEVLGLYNNLTQEVNEALKDNKIGTQKDLADLKQSLNKNDIELSEEERQTIEIEKIKSVLEKLNIITNNFKLFNPDMISKLDSSKMDQDEKQKLFYEVRNNTYLISSIKDDKIIKEFFEFYKGIDLTNHYKFTSSYLQVQPSIINSYIKNTNQLNLDLIPDSYFIGNNNIESITNEIINGNSSKLETRIRALLQRIKGNDDNIKICLSILCKDDYYKEFINENLPLEIRKNEKIIKFLADEKGVHISNNIENNETNAFEEISNKILKLNYTNEYYNSDKNELINKLDKFIIKNGVPNMELFKKVISSNIGNVEGFSCINYNKKIALEAVKASSLVFLNLSTELRKDIDIIKNTITNKDLLGFAYFINIDSEETLINSYKHLKSLGCDDVSIFKIQSFSNGVEKYANGKNNDINLKTIKTNKEKQSNSFSEILKGFELILTKESKKDFEQIIIENLKDNTKTKNFIDILYKNNNFSIETYKENYSKLLELCSGNEEILKNIFNGLVDKQSEIYSNPEKLNKTVKELIKENDFDLVKIKKILGVDSELSKYVTIEINGENNEEISINNELLINNFKNHYNELLQNNKVTTKEYAIESYLTKLGLGDTLGIEDGKLREILGGILQFDYKKVEVQTIADNKELAWNYTSGKISKEQYEKLFQENYNENLKKNGLPNQNNGDQNNSVKKENIEYSNYNYDQNSGIIEVNTNSGKQIIELSNEEQKLIDNNPDAIDNIVNFYKFFKDLNLIGVWDYRREIVKSIGNINIDLSDDSLSKSELINFGNKLIGFINNSNTDSQKLANNNNTISSLNNELLKYSKAGSMLSDNKSYNLKGEDIFTARLRELGIIGGAYFHLNKFTQILNGDTKKES